MQHPVNGSSHSTASWPNASREADGQQCVQQLSEEPCFARPLSATEQQAVVAVAGNSLYLARLMLKHPERMAHYFAHGSDQSWQDILAQPTPYEGIEQPELMQRLRHKKAESALLIALSDISGEWDLGKVTHALSTLAEKAVVTALRYLLLRAHAKGELALANVAEPENETGIIILGMGKLGGYELNYSSDIDLIVLYEQAALPYTGSRNPQHFMNKLASDLVALLEERTSDGYVFRTDLRLRPDPMSTPLAVTTSAALSYYETVGQNWERAAMIKARPIAGDPEASHRYMQDLVPFIWRKTLDFATIADIHSIKRQMNVKAGQTISLPGHNIKTGMGGIREIEFFVQTQQLVWGGRTPELRTRATLDSLAQLTKYELVDEETRDVLTRHYIELRRIEHRLQMRHDAQTHSLPKTDDEMQEVAIFCGFNARESFERICLKLLQEVHAIYTDSMQDSAPLAVDGNLVFTGVEADPDTLKTLERMGYAEAQRVSDIIQGWHRGHRRSTRSKRSRQVLTELIPALLTALSQTANPDAAFFNFDDFIDRIPSGAQIFSLFLSRPEMLSLLADILGSAPALGDTLSNDPSLLDSVLEADFYAELPSKEALENIVTERLRFAHAFEQKMIYLRTFNSEKRFQAGVQLLQGIARPTQVGRFLSDVAEVVLQSTMQEVWAEYAQNVPGIRAIPFAVVALGKLGGREMTFGSDLDIVFIYDDPEDASLDTRLHLSRISQRLINALTLLTREGRLYEVDTRLRPGGSDGPLAVNIVAFDTYFTNSAWTYEHMALSRARVVATNTPTFAARVEETIRRHVLKPREAAPLLHDVLEMRERIAREFRTQNPWALKHMRGGMVDLDFIAQYLVLRYGAAHPTIWARDAFGVFTAATKLGLLPADTPLLSAKTYMTDLMSLLRLSATGGVITDDAPAGLKRLLTERMQVPDFEALKTALLKHEQDVVSAFDAMAKS